ncbi:MAG: winged helix-turn-helix transcriptional regulator [Deltaproteobacteria bacterium]|nr:winged helix-turn-helix transcriptional regulator [Deltaproteobacteria bacterium]
MTAQKTELPESLIEDLLPKFFKAFCDPTRIRIIQLILEKERNVTDLIANLGISQSGVSNHLACLKWCGFVSSRKEGKNIYYQVTDERIQKIIYLASQIIAENAEHIYACTRI